MPQNPSYLKPPNDTQGALGTAAAPFSSSSPPLPLSASPNGSRSSRSGRSRRGGSSSSTRRRLRRGLGSTQKLYAPHVCCFSPFRPPAAAVLDPFPSLRIDSICMAGMSTLVTVHRSGVRLYRERHLSPPLNTTASFLQGSAALRTPPLSTTLSATASTTAAIRGVSTTSGVFELLEARSNFQLRESYLCAAMQPVLVDDAALLSKWSRYFCVASGNDRVVHSVAVMSSAAHFCLHHERHQMNKVVCLHCTQIATEPFHPAVLTPAVASVDEVGTVVLFDVEREVPCVLEKAPLWFRQSDGRVPSQPGTVEDLNTAQGSHSRHPQRTPLLNQHLRPEEEDHVVDAMEKVPVKESAAYHLDRGVATRVTLVGPCLELCNHCHNAFTSLSTSRGYTLVSVYVCSRSHDLPSDTTQQDCSTAAELNVTLLRVLWGPRRAFVLEEVKIVQEAAPTDVCEAGVALAARPYQVGLPMTLLLARPALTLWQLRACTGERIDTRNLYRTTGSSSSKSGRYGSPPRAASEFIIHWVPLGRHRLTMQNDDRVGPQSWFCIAAVTDDDTVLLLGRAPQRCTTSSAVSPAAHTPVRSPVQSASAAPLKAEEEEPGKFRDADLEGWLDDIHTSPTSNPPYAAPLESSKGKSPANDATSADNGSSFALPYTVLMKLYSPASSSSTHETGNAAPSVAAGVVSIMPDLHDNRLLLFMADEEALLSVPLPFAERIATLTDSDVAKEQEEEGRTGAAGRPRTKEGLPVQLSTEASASKTKMTTTAGGGGSVKGAAETTTSHRSSSYLWGATSTTVSGASQGWSSSMLKWAPSSSSSFFFPGNASPSRNTSAASAAAGAPPTASAKADAGSAVRRDAAAPSLFMPPHASANGADAPPPTAATEAFHPFSIVRPLMAAVFHLTGEGKEALEPPVQPTPLPAIADADGGAAKKELAEAEGGSPPIPPAVPPPPLEGLPSAEHISPAAHARSSSGNSEASTVVSATAARTAAAVSLAMPIRVAHGERQRSGSCAASCGSRHSSHRRRHRRQHRLPSSESLPEEEDLDNSSGAGNGSRAGDSKQRRGRGGQSAESSKASFGSTPASLPPRTIATDKDAMQASYMEAQMNLLTKDTSTPTTRGVVETGTAGPNPARRGEEIHLALRHLTDVDEPLGRNTILYNWKDGHNDLYIRLSVEQDALEQAAAAQQPHRNGNGPASPRGRHETHPATTTTAVLTNTTADVAEGVHSVGFVAKYRSVVAWRAETSTYGDCFNFAEYFATLQVPPRLSEVQEQDKCRLELADLRLQQARDMAAVHPYALTTVYRNEERTSSEAEWRLHATFPYDDERDGSVVDLNWLNRTAGSTRSTRTPEWRWATEREASIWAEEEGALPSATARVRSLVKELKDWSVGPWEYAERWPSRGDSLSGGAATFVWSAVEAPAHRCRRRRLTRLRVDVAELRRQTELTASHIRELDALRAELAL
ncbi:hypothetical protein ABB37_09537 [Leptomonas pyrrhocoris]|uniref:Uncharacterized protein n=1 Tax=Leptomonas pyrrhocoris TaxID=157538 RepID=A0A0M9FQD6_LEPPY|nr:hypothetical protein ABB37_09537 [Leptomonas pyrrhocoris]XP_015652390.1 hypothetical protein ABB37_09537 [Leptomonas pyrrhocoris]KPA73950.1 hypothetical protein ABB37_09537 [Leptomonas pyrrhocoris]KPA73951.1 hypothetical protein ABB37_09537 [Leptomonas pyrrhocoris]|eukprot:XP_015652389.1 hypothetical protein ABB37_09537 [Leptomonas pyrrhocoris]